jgi:hypothetical protein
MMDLLVTLVTVLLGGTAVWLWRLGKANMLRLSLTTSLGEDPRVAASPEPTMTRLARWYERKIQPLFGLSFDELVTYIVLAVAVAGFCIVMYLLFIYLSGGEHSMTLFFSTALPSCIFLYVLYKVFLLYRLDRLRMTFRGSTGRIYTGYIFCQSKFIQMTLKMYLLN